MEIADLDFYRTLLHGRSGLTLTQDKAYLLESRLTPVAKKWEFPSLEDMTKSLRGNADEKIVIDVVEAMTTNETSFFRDQRPFQIFQEFVLPYMLKERATQKKLRIWCAAASSGQEPYSLAMTIKENAAQLAGWNIEIVATDISHEILDKARKGVYSQFDVQRGLPIQLLMKYFEQRDENWALKDEIKSMIKFDYFNLLDSMSSLGQFDIILCRNVLIYFDEATKADVLKRMNAQMAKDAYLFLGGAETVLGITDVFKPLPEHRGLYVRSNGEYNF
jgi:chemotaxis protein methyltransferase CheR